MHESDNLTRGYKNKNVIRCFKQRSYSLGLFY